MSKAPLFLHRPPSAGVHLLSDPLPERIVAPPADITLAAAKAVVGKRVNRPATKAKNGLRS
jgi:hypothetical protein